MKSIKSLIVILLISSCSKTEQAPNKQKQSIIEVTVIELPPASDSVYNITLRP